MPRNGRADVALFRRDRATDNRMINLLHGASGELRGKREVRRVVLGDHEAAAGFLVEPVHDAGAHHAADAAELTGGMVQQRVDERVRLVPGGRVHDHAGRFVEHQQVVVLEKNIERDFLRLRRRGPGVRPVDFDFLAHARMVRGFDRPAVHANVPLFDEALHGAARDRREPRAQKDVEPFARQRFINDDHGFVSRGHSTSDSQ